MVDASLAISITSLSVSALWGFIAYRKTNVAELRKEFDDLKKLHEKCQRDLERVSDENIRLMRRVIRLENKIDRSYRINPAEERDDC